MKRRCRCDQLAGMLPVTHRDRAVNTLNVLSIASTGALVILSFLTLQIYLKVVELGKTTTFSRVLSSNCNVELLK